MTNHLNVVGHPLPKVDAWDKVTGQTRFADDLVLPRTLYCKLLRSPWPHARIRGIDPHQAQALPGVFAVITGHDLPVKYGILPVSQDEEALALEKVRYVGDPVAAVAAADEQTAEEALNLIEVDYEPLPAIMSIEEALKRSDVPIHDYGDNRNVHKQVSLEFGDVDGGFAQADYVREDMFYFEGNTHLPLEQHSSMATFGPDGKLTIWSSTQTPHYLHRALEKTLGIPRAHIRVIATPNGGGFGGKSDPFNHEIIVCKLAIQTGRPVKITLTREEVFYAHRGRHPVLMWIKTGVKNDGRITAMDFKSFLDGGGYGSYGVASTYYTGALQTVTYDVPAYRFRGLRVFTNKPPCGPKRGHGTPQPRFALEVHLDKIAHDLGLDPYAMRRAHIVPDDSMTINQLHVTTNGLGQCLDAVVKASGWAEKRKPESAWRTTHTEQGEAARTLTSERGAGNATARPGAEKQPYSLPSPATRPRGIGLAGSSYISGAGLPIYWNNMPHSGVQIKIDRGGGVAVFCGSTDIGQGSDSVLAYIVAELLGIEPKDIRVITADTDLTPVDLGSYSSRVTLMTGNAAIEAATKLRKILFEVAAEKLRVPPESLSAKNRLITCEDDENRVLPFVEVVQMAEARHGTLGAVGSYTPAITHGKYKGSGVGPTPAYSYSACIAEITCDPETGEYTVDKLTLAHDTGKAINPLLVIGQVEGSAYMGLGEIMMEEQVFRKGLHKIPSMLDYKSPTTLETPEMSTILVETLDPNGPFGAKESGQGPLLPVIPAIANAIYDALGVRIDEVPATPEKILKALELKARHEEPRIGPKRIPDYAFPPPLKVPPLPLKVKEASPLVTR
ncbi:MAG: molybdopterin-dependent oxidoreductase [Chloroflexi bacterium]|nr:molybdopterin-dependent oxidoreductase [Chloroflexota bacterium]